MHHLVKVIFVLLLAITSASIEAETANDNPRFDSNDPAKQPLSVPLRKLQDRMNSDPSCEGMEFKIKPTGKRLDVDLLAIQGSSSVAAVSRCVFIMGRIAEANYDEMAFTNDGKLIFKIDGPAMRRIGRQFVWGEEGKGQNPIALMRDFVDALQNPDGSRVAPPFTGSLLGDTTTTMRTMNQEFNPRWVIEGVRMK